MNNVFALCLSNLCRQETITPCVKEKRKVNPETALGGAGQKQKTKAH